MTVYGNVNGIPVVQGGVPDGCAVYGSASATVTQASWQGVVPTAGVGCDEVGGNPNGLASGTDPLTVCCMDVEG